MAHSTRFRRSSVRRLVLGVSSLAALPCLAVAQSSAERGRPLAIEDFYRVKTIAAPEISPDGRWVVFNVMTKVEATNSETGELWVVPTDGSAPARQVVPAGGAVGAGRWSVDGQLCFMSGGSLRAIDPAVTTSPDTAA